MSEEKKYTIVVKHQRVEVSEAVYHAYHQERESERYQNKLAQEYELSLERFQNEGVNVEYMAGKHGESIEDKLIWKEQLKKLHLALQLLNAEEQVLIKELFFNDKSERMLASELGIANMTVHDRKHRILKKLKNLIKD